MREEGGSAALVRWADRVDARAPGLAPVLGFWLAVYARFARHRGSVLAGGLAFFGMLSLVPSLLSLAALIALLVDPAQFAEDLRALLADRPDIVVDLDPALDQLAAVSDTTLATLGTAGILGIMVSLYAASRCVYVGRQVLDIAFELDPEPPSLFSRGIAVVVTLLAQVAVVAGVVALTLVPRALDALGVGAIYSVGIRYLRLPATVLVVYLLLTASMRYGTRLRRAVPWANLGAALGTLLIVVGTVGLGWYLSFSVTYSQIVAWLGGVIALEIWLYLIGLAVVGAAEVEGMRLGRRRRDLQGRATAGPGRGSDDPP